MTRLSALACLWTDFTDWLKDKEVLEKWKATSEFVMKGVQGAKDRMFCFVLFTKFTFIFGSAWLLLCWSVCHYDYRKTPCLIITKSCQSGPLSALIGWGTCCFLIFMSVHKDFETNVDNKTPAALRSTPSLPVTLLLTAARTTKWRRKCQWWVWVLFGWMDWEGGTGERIRMGGAVMWCDSSKTVQPQIRHYDVLHYAKAE